MILLIETVRRRTELFFKELRLAKYQAEIRFICHDITILCLFICSHSSQTITETFGSQTQNVTSTKTGVRFVQIYVEMIQRLQFYSFLDVLRFAGIDLVAEVPPKECTERVVCCDGGDPHLGHPKVYINLVRYWFESGIDWHDEVNLIITFVF